MGLSKKELRERWRTKDGKERLAAVVEALQKGEKWEDILEAFPGVDEVSAVLGKGRDLRGADFKNVDLSSANLNLTHIRGARFHNSILKDSNLRYVRASDSNFRGANLERADLSYGRFEQAGFYSARLEGTKLRSCILDRSALIKCVLDIESDFRNSNLDAARCDHETLNHIKYNNRRLNWEDWYKRHPFAQWPVRLFWWLSEYGTSEKNLFLAFVLGALGFALLYWNFPDTIIGLSTYDNKPVTASLLLRSIYFSIVTMTTLGFGDIHASPDSNLGHVFLTTQVLIGYMLLGALISRLAILFQSGGPTDILKPDSLDELEKEKAGEEFREWDRNRKKK